jgi:nucleotide-binding universal stress UspA family protein
MTQARRLVFADDQSPSADVAWLWLTCHEWPGWVIEALTVVSPDQGEIGVPRAWQPTHPRQLHPGATTPVHHVQVPGQATAILTGLLGRDLVVVGPKGRGSRKALHLGSVSEALVRDPPIPVVVARHGTPTSRVLVCADGSADSRAAIEALRGMPWLGHANVLVATVPEAGMADPPQVVKDTITTLGRHARSVRGEVLAPDDLAIVVNPRAVLLDAGRRWQADLTVLGSRGLSGITAITAGSIATALAAHAPSSILLARAR